MASNRMPIPLRRSIRNGIPGEGDEFRICPSLASKRSFARARCVPKPPAWGRGRVARGLSVMPAAREGRFATAWGAGQTPAVSCPSFPSSSLGTQVSWKLCFPSRPAKLELRRQWRSQAGAWARGGTQASWKLCFSGCPAKLELRRHLRSQAGAWERGRERGWGGWEAACRLFICRPPAVAVWRALRRLVLRKRNPALRRSRLRTLRGPA